LDVFGQADGDVVALYGPLDVFGREVRQLAARAALVATEAEEVQVLALGFGQTETAAAATANHA
jgi:hypothetical protein